MTFDSMSLEIREIADSSLFTLPDGETLDLWLGTLDLESSLLDDLLVLFSEEEKERVARFLYKTPRDRFIAARGILRRVLSLYKGVKPQELEFHYGPYGKPELCGPGTEPEQAPRKEKGRIHFNLSHSGERFILAISLQDPVGVDIEEMSSTIDFKSIAHRFFCQNEYAALESLPSDRRKEAFYRCWTLKEAYVKARGEAMWDHMGRIEIPFLDRKVTVRDRDGERLWHLCEIQAGPHHRAALAVRGNPGRLRCFSYALR
jgi:4'-phosphopantetheinyl transferase